jgi:hypothetical protein
MSLAKTAVIIIVTRFPAGPLSTKQQFNPGAKNRQQPDLTKKALQPSRSLGRLWLHHTAAVLLFIVLPPSTCWC